MMLLLLQIDRLLHLQATLLKSVRLHPHRGQQLARSQGWTVSLHKNLFLRNCVEGRERKSDGQLKRWVDYMRILSACLPLCQRISRGRQAEAKVCTIVCATQNLEAQGAVHSALKTGIAIACANNFKVQEGFKFFSNQPRNQASDSKFSKY
jgi:hypothetical protein